MKMTAKKEDNLKNKGNPKLKTFGIIEEVDPQNED